MENTVRLEGDFQPYIENIAIEDPGDIFHCGKCKMNFNSFVEFVSHKKDHSSEQLNQVWLLNPAPAPSEISNPVNVQYSHIIQRIDQADVEIVNTDVPVAEKNIFTCSVCQRQFKKQFNYYFHMKSHSDEKSHQCIICGRSFSQKSNSKKHMMSHRVWPDNLSKTLPEEAVGSDLGFKCVYCGTILPDYYKLKVHRKQHHHEKVYKCIQRKCAATYQELESLIHHVQNDHETVEYHCYMCPSVLTSLQEMSVHQKEHLQTKVKKETKKYPCLLCGSIFKKHFHLTHHLSTANHSNCCPRCDKSFTTEKALRRHLSLHDENKSYKCDICNASFRNKHYLRSHMATHSSKSFVCSICDRKFSRKDLMMRHVKIHQPHKRISCPFRALLDCSMQFTRTDKLNQHIRSHKNVIVKRKNGIKKVKNEEKNIQT